MMLSLVALGARQPSANIDPDSITYVPLLLTSGNHTIETAHLSPGADTVLRVWDVAIDDEITWNDDYTRSSKASRVVVSNPSARPRSVFV